MASNATPAGATPAPARPISTSVDPNSSTLGPGSFYSVLPQLDSVLDALRGLTEGEEVVGGVEASEAVAGKAKELHNALEFMKSAALSIPGGELSRDEILELERRMEEEAEKRRKLLRAFAAGVPNITSSIPPADPKTAMDEDLASANGAGGEEG